MSTDWNHVAQILAPIITKMKNPRVGRLWLNKLKITPTGQRLAICLAIDLLSKSLTGALVVAVLDKIPKYFNDPIAAFTTACDAVGTTKFASRYSGHPQTDEPYVRILELGDFILFYLYDRGYTLEEEDVERVRAAYLDKPEGTPLGDIRKPWSGSRGTIWVTSKKEVTDLQGNSGGKFPEVLADVLGLSLPSSVGPYNTLDLVAVEYPLGRPECWQPTCFDVGWTNGGGLYVSYGYEDRWGRTHSCSGNPPRMRERIHKTLEPLTDEFRLRRVGPAPKPAINADALLAAAYARLKLPQSSMPRPRSNIRKKNTSLSQNIVPRGRPDGRKTKDLNI